MDLAIARFLVACLIASSVGAAPAPASAQPATIAPPVPDPSTLARARELFQRGVSLSQEGRWQGALEAFEASARLRPHAATTYDIAFCERAIGHLTRAEQLFRLALQQNAASDGAELKGGLVARSEAYLAELAAQVAVVSVTMGRAGLLLSVDGRPLEAVSMVGARLVVVAGTRPPALGEAAPAAGFDVRADPGDHLFVVSAAGGDSRVTKVRVARGERVQVVLEGPLDVATAARRRTFLRTGSFALGAVGLAGLGVAAGLAVHAKLEMNAARDACPALQRCPDNRAFDSSSAAVREGNLATVAVVFGGAALAGGLVLWLSALAVPEGTRTGLRFVTSPAATSLAWEGSF